MTLSGWHTAEALVILAVSKRADKKGIKPTLTSALRPVWGLKDGRSRIFTRECDKLRPFSKDITSLYTT